MAVDLVLRLCQQPEDDGGLPGSDDGSVPAHTNIALNDFVDGLYDLAFGVHTPANMKTFYDMPGSGGAQVNQQASFDSLWAQITMNDPDTAAPPELDVVMARIHRFRSILTKYERKDDLNLSGYDSPDDVQTWFLIIGEIGSTPHI